MFAHGPGFVYVHVCLRLCAYSHVKYGKKLSTQGLYIYLFHSGGDSGCWCTSKQLCSHWYKAEREGEARRWFGRVGGGVRFAGHFVCLINESELLPWVLWNKWWWWDVRQNNVHVRSRD